MGKLNDKMNDLLNHPKVKTIQITDWKTFADSDDDISTYSHLPIMKVELINEPVTTTNEHPKITEEDRLLLRGCIDFRYGNEELRKRLYRIVDNKCPKGECTYSRSCPGNCI